MKKKLALFTILVVLTFALTSCDEIPQNDWLQAPDWSRSQYVGVTVSADGVPFLIDEENDSVYFLMATANNESISYVRAFDGEMNLAWETQFSHNNAHVSQMHMAFDGDDLDLFWIDGYSLYYGKLAKNGDILLDAEKISGDLTIARLDVVNVDDEVLVWASGNKSHLGVYEFTNADNFSTYRTIFENGFQPYLRKDVNGDVHAVFLSYADGLTLPTFYYSSSVNGNLGDEIIEITKQKIGSTSVFYGPWIGVEDNLVYLFWSEKITTGMTAGMKNTYYMTFDMNTLEASEKKEAFVPYEYNLPFNYQFLENDDLLSGDRFDMKESYDVAGGYVTFDHMQTNTSAAHELALIAEADVKYKWRNENYQAAIQYYNEGVATSYQLLTFTSYDTHDVLVSSDSENYLHAVWTEDNSLVGHSVYYATTSPETVAVLSELGWSDYRTIIAETVFEVLAGIAISPLVGAIYMVAPLLTVAITSFLRKFSNPTLKTIGTLVSLGIAIAAYETIKPATLPGYETFIPFSPWIRDISYSVGLILQKAVPILIAMIALFVGWWFTYKRSNENAINFIMLYVGTNVILSMMIYGLLLYYAV